MPNSIIKSFSEKSGKSVSTIEGYWDSIKQGLIDDGKKESDDDFYGLLVSILKKKLKIKSSEKISEDIDDIIDDILEYRNRRLEEDFFDDVINKGAGIAVGVGSRILSKLKRKKKEDKEQVDIKDIKRKIDLENEIRRKRLSKQDKNTKTMNKIINWNLDDPINNLS